MTAEADDKGGTSDINRRICGTLSTRPYNSTSRYNGTSGQHMQHIVSPVGALLGITGPALAPRGMPGYPGHSQRTTRMRATASDYPIVSVATSSFTWCRSRVTLVRYTRLLWGGLCAKITAPLSTPSQYLKHTFAHVALVIIIP